MHLDPHFLNEALGCWDCYSRTLSGLFDSRSAVENPQFQSLGSCHHDLETALLTSVNLLFGTELRPPSAWGRWCEFNEKTGLQDPAQCLVRRKCPSMVAFIMTRAWRGP